MVFDVFDKVYEEDYSKRITFLQENGFGLWDVLQKAEREGSLDTAIKNHELNDFEELLKMNKSIKRFYFTSKQAYLWYYKRYKNDLDVELIVLASPSPANARLTYKEKLKDWKSKIQL